MLVVPWRIELFGGPRLFQGSGRVITRFRTEKTGALLACLALFPRQSFSREVLADRFWPEDEPESGRHSLRQALSSLRRHLEIPEVAPGSVLVSPTRGGISLNPAAFTTDVAEFEAAILRAERTHTIGDERLVELRRAESLYVGELLPGLYDEWALGERDRLAEKRRLVLQRLALLLAEAGEIEEALEISRRAVALDPLCEGARARLLGLLLSAGRTESARQEYRDFAEVLDEELGVAPSPEFTAMAGGAAVASADPGAPPGTSRRAKPITALKAAIPPAERERNPRAALPTASASLPPGLNRFFGREPEIARILQLMLPCEGEPARLVTLVGPGGCGKSRLAVQAAWQLSGVSGTGLSSVYFVPLADLSDARLIPQAIMRAVGLESVHKDDSIEETAALVSAREDPVVLLLDNFEQLAPGGGAMVETLLRKAPTVSCLVTSRRRLGVTGEQLLPVNFLSVPDQDELSCAEEAAAFPSVQLFVDRAQSINPDFTLSNRNASAVSTLCRRLEGSPLALELAAAWAGSLTPAQISKRLEAGLFRLSADKKGRRSSGRPARHTSLWAAIESSLDLLPERMQLLFSRLSVFRGGWTIESAETVCEEPEARHFLEHLRLHSLVQAIHSGLDVRFRMLETLREYAQEKLLNKERPLLQRRFISAFESLAYEAEPHLAGEEQQAWLDRLEDEHDNLRQALTFCLEVAQGDQKGLRIAAALQPFWATRGYLTEGRIRLSALLAQPEGQRRTTLRVRALNRAGTLAWLQSDYASARTLHEESLEISGELQDRQGTADSLNHLGYIAWFQGDYTSARSLHEQCLELREELRDRFGIAESLDNLGNIANDLGDYAAARTLYAQSAEKCEKWKNRTGIVASVLNLGSIAKDQGDYTAARGLFEESLEIRRRLGDRMGAADSMIPLGLLVYQEGDHAAARSLFAESLRIYKELGDRKGIVEALESFARLNFAEDKLEQASRLWGAAEQLREGIGSPLPPNALDEFNIVVATARQAMSAEAFSAAWTEGRAMTEAQAITRALDQSL